MQLTDTQMFTLLNTVFRDEWPGFKPNVIESPDGNAQWDTEKLYSHINKAYYSKVDHGKQWVFNTPMEIHKQWCHYARHVAMRLGVPPEFWPQDEDSTIRILMYPPGASTARHTDFDLFTLPMYRNITECYTGVFDEDTIFEEVNTFQRLHIGELLHEINPTFKATPHFVKPDERRRWQYSAVFFAIPDHHAMLPNHGPTVGEWLEERKGRSRRET